MGPRQGRDRTPGGEDLRIKAAPWRRRTGACRRAERVGFSAVLAALATTPAHAATGTLPSDFVFTLIVIAAAALALAGGAWAFSEHRATRAMRHALALTQNKARAAVAARDALVAAGRESVIVWGANLTDPISFGGGAELIEACLTGPDSMAVATALDLLADQGVPFTMQAHTRDGRMLNVRGRPAGGFAAVYLESEPEPEAAAQPDYRAVLEALPIPAWLRARDLALTWANRSYLTSAGAPSLSPQPPKTWRSTVRSAICRRPRAAKATSSKPSAMR